MEENDAFGVLKNISEYVTLVKLMNSIRNVNHAISIVGHWISESNYKKALFLKQESLDIICSPSVGEWQSVTFDPYFMLLIKFGNQFIFKKDKHDTIS